ncbi:hypothetical protein [Methanosarcina mazei]|uniref:hypothetical protein n=1 Tax=Methanosarcina mazei TaxID=2209 RepID=UPI0012D44ED1|nr:hypothetical protein [Methanosarcina mazei]
MLASSISKLTPRLSSSFIISSINTPGSCEWIWWNSFDFPGSPPTLVILTPQEGLLEASKG